ncbi:hypothetical protein Q5752_003107 [Cryptotrichosporon argae]
MLSPIASCSRRAAPVAARPLALAVRSAVRHVSRRPTSVPTTSTPPPAPPASTSEPTSPALPRALPYRRGLVLVALPIPPSAWPSHLDGLSPLLSALSAWAKPLNLGVNAIYDGVGRSTFPRDPRAREAYPARMLYPDGKVFAFPSLSVDGLAQLDEAAAYVPAQTARAHGQAEVLVCTHGARDCRCADRGGPLVDALRDEVARRGLEGKVGVYEVAHVGGHKFAANAITLPALDMLSKLSAADAPAVVAHARGEAGLWAQWRGRLGLTEDEQAAVWVAVDPARRAAADGAVAGTADGAAAAAGTNDAANAKADARAAGTDKVRLVFRTFDGERREVDAERGKSLLEVGKAASLPSLEGVCGGNLECATCHLYIDAPLPPPTEDEQDMLGYALGYKDGRSRLGCQVRVDDGLAAWAARGGEIGLPQF